LKKEFEVSVPKQLQETCFSKAVAPISES